MDFRTQLAAELPPLRRFARALTGDPALADDLVQDCVERAMVKGHLYDPSRPLRAWLYAVLRNIYHQRPAAQRAVHHREDGG